jgi:hypothetical protein
VEGPGRTCADRAALPGVLADLAGAASSGTEATARSSCWGGAGAAQNGARCQSAEKREGDGDGQWPRVCVVGAR